MIKTLMEKVVSLVEEEPDTWELLRSVEGHNHIDCYYHPAGFVLDPWGRLFFVDGKIPYDWGRCDLRLVQRLKTGWMNSRLLKKTYKELLVEKSIRSADRHHLKK